MKKNLLFLLLLISTISVFAQGDNAQKGKQFEGQRKYALTIQESDNNSIQEFNRNLTKSTGNRGFISDIFNLYRSNFSNQVVSMSSELLELGITAITEAVKSKRPKWEEAVKKESEFIRVFPAQMEVLDFYKSPSTKGPMDPADMLFSGFGCKQYIEYKDSLGVVHQEEVFSVLCKVRTDSLGVARMLNHSKFEVYVDHLSFNPGLCDLPNDSLGLDASKRIAFSFEKRKDLKFSIKATIKSSWMNQAMMVFNDCVLGTFNITANIDPKHLNEDGVFVYSHEADKNSDKLVTITGDSFLVPRSYVGTTDLQQAVDSWGTGQYKIDMEVQESCLINEGYYVEDGRWQKSKWRPEWKMLRKRKNHAKSAWNKVLNVLGVKYANGAWVATLVDPMKTYIIQVEKGALTKASSEVLATPPSDKKGNDAKSGAFLP